MPGNSKEKVLPERVAPDGKESNPPLSHVDRRPNPVPIIRLHAAVGKPMDFLEARDVVRRILETMSAKGDDFDAAELSEAERRAVWRVLQRDEALKQQHEQRILKLRAELQWLRRRGSLKADGSDAPGSSRHCARCRAELGLILNRGATCKGCNFRVCKQCRHYNITATEWVCLVCHKQGELKAATGEWMTEFSRRPSRRRDKVHAAAPDGHLSKKALKRSWTISNPSGTGRNSPDLQQFRKLSDNPPYHGSSQNVHHSHHHHHHQQQQQPRHFSHSPQSRQQHQQPAAQFIAHRLPAYPPSRHLSPSQAAFARQPQFHVQAGTPVYYHAFDPQFLPPGSDPRVGYRRPSDRGPIYAMPPRFPSAPAEAHYASSKISAVNAVGNTMSLPRPVRTRSEDPKVVASNKQGYSTLPRPPRSKSEDCDRFLEPTASQQQKPKKATKVGRANSSISVTTTAKPTFSSNQGSVSRRSSSQTPQKPPRAHPPVRRASMSNLDAIRKFEEVSSNPAMVVDGTPRTSKLSWHQRLKQGKDPPKDPPPPPPGQGGSLPRHKSPDAIKQRIAQTEQLRLALVNGQALPGPPAPPRRRQSPSAEGRRVRSSESFKETMLTATAVRGAFAVRAKMIRRRTSSVCDSLASRASSSVVDDAFESDSTWDSVSAGNNEKSQKGGSSSKRRYQKRGEATSGDEIAELRARQFISKAKTFAKLASKHQQQVSGARSDAGNEGDISSMGDRSRESSRDVSRNVSRDESRDDEFLEEDPMFPRMSKKAAKNTAVSDRSHSQDSGRRRSADNLGSPALIRRVANRQQIPSQPTPPPSSANRSKSPGDYGSLDRVVRRKDKTTVISVRPLVHQASPPVVTSQLSTPPPVASGVGPRGFDFCASLDRRKRTFDQFGEPLKASSPIQRSRNGVTSVVPATNSSFGSNKNASNSSSGSSAKLNESHQSDVALDPQKIHQGGEDYKIVFISSDSSRDSEINTSVEDEQQQHLRNARKYSLTSSTNKPPTVIGEFIEDDPPADWEGMDRPQNPLADGGRSRVQQAFRHSGDAILPPDLRELQYSDLEVGSSTDGTPSTTSTKQGVYYPNQPTHVGQNWRDRASSVASSHGRRSSNLNLSLGDTDDELAALTHRQLQSSISNNDDVECQEVTVNFRDSGSVPPSPSPYHVVPIISDYDVPKASKARHAANRSSSLRIFPTSYHDPNFVAGANKYYPGSRARDIRPAEYHGYSSGRGYDSPHRPFDYPHQFDNQGGTVIIIKGDKTPSDSPPSPDAKRHSPAGSASVEFENPHHRDERVYATPSSVLKPSSSGSTSSNQTYATPIRGVHNNGQDGPGMAVHYVRSVKAIQEKDQERRNFTDSSTSCNNLHMYKHQDTQSDPQSDDSSVGDHSTDDSSIPSLGKVKIKINDGGTVIKGSANAAGMVMRHQGDGERHRGPPTGARPEPTGASTDGSACNTSSASSHSEGEDEEGFIGQRAFREAEAQAHSSDFGVDCNVEHCEECDDGPPPVMNDCATQTSDNDDDSQLEFEEGVPGGLQVPTTTQGRSRESTPGVEWDGSMAQVNSRAATIAESSICEDDLESMFDGEDRWPTDDGREGVTAEDEPEFDAPESLDNMDADTMRRRHFMRLAPATQVVHGGSRHGSETEADFLDRDGDFEVDPAAGIIGQDEGCLGDEIVPAPEAFDDDVIEDQQDIAATDASPELEVALAAVSAPITLTKPRAPGAAPPLPPAASAGGDESTAATALAPDSENRRADRDVHVQQQPPLEEKPAVAPDTASGEGGILEEREPTEREPEDPAESDYEDEMIDKASTTSSTRGVTIVNLRKDRRSSLDSSTVDGNVSDTAVTVITIDSESSGSHQSGSKRLATGAVTTLRVGETSSESNPSSSGEEDVDEEVTMAMAMAVDGGLESYYSQFDDGATKPVAKPRGIMKKSTVIKVSEEELFDGGRRVVPGGLDDDDGREDVVGVEEDEEHDDSRLDEDGSLLSDESDSRYQQFEAEPYVYESDNSGPYDGGDDRADCDSWGEPASDYSESAASSGDEAYFDREEELRGYHRAIDFTLHTIIEESCEESDGERRSRNGSPKPPPPSQMEKYFYYDIGAGAPTSNSSSFEENPASTSSSTTTTEPSRKVPSKTTVPMPQGILKKCRRVEPDPEPQVHEDLDESISDTSSSFLSESVDEGQPGDAQGAVGGDDTVDPADLAGSRLEKYFMNDFLGLDPHRATQKNGARLSAAGEDVNIGSIKRTTPAKKSAQQEEDKDEEESAPSSEDGDGSDSVGSESDGQPSPERKRKKVMKPRNHRRGSQENLLRSCSTEDRCQQEESDQNSIQEPQTASSNSQPSSSAEESIQSSIIARKVGSSSEEEIVFDKNDGQFDTIKRRKKKKALLDFSSDSEIRSTAKALVETERKRHSGGEFEVVVNAALIVEAVNAEPEEPEVPVEVVESQESASAAIPLPTGTKKHRDSGFIGSSDDLLSMNSKIVDRGSASPAGSDSSSASSKKSDDSGKDDERCEVEPEQLKEIAEEKIDEEPAVVGECSPGKDSVDSGEVCSRSSSNASAFASPASKHRDRTSVSRKDSFNNWSSDEETNLMMSRMRAFFRHMITSANKDACAKGTPKVKPPQMADFEQKLTSLMKTVPGINDDQVKEIVEYLSSEDTWSDSYDSSDYTSSDLEGACANLDVVPEFPADLRNQISASCQEIIEKFDGQTKKTSSPVAALPEMAALPTVPPRSSPGGSTGSPVGADGSPPMFAKVMQHIGTRLVALMHQVSENASDNSEDFWSPGSLQAVTSSPKLVPASIKTNAVDDLSDDEDPDGATPKASPCSTLKTALNQVPDVNSGPASMFYSSFSPNETPKASPHSTLKTPLFSPNETPKASPESTLKSPLELSGVVLEMAPSLSSSGTGSSLNSEATVIERPQQVVSPVVASPLPKLEPRLLAGLSAASIIGPIDDPDAPPPRERYVGDPEEELALLSKMKANQEESPGYQPSWLSNDGQRKKGRTGWRVGLSAAKKFKSKSQDALVVKEKMEKDGTASGDELESPAKKATPSSSRLPSLIARHKATPSPVESARHRPTPTTDKVSVFGFMSATPSSGKSARLSVGSPAVTMERATPSPTPVSTPGGVRSARYRPMSSDGASPLLSSPKPAMTSTPQRIDSPDSTISTATSSSSSSGSSGPAALLRKNKGGAGSHSGGRLTYSVQGTDSPKPRNPAVSASLARLTSPALSAISKTLTPPESPAVSSRGSDGSGSPPLSSRKISSTSAPAVVSPAWSESESEDLDRYFAYQRGKSGVREESMSVNSTLSDLSGFNIANIVPVRGEVQFSVQFNEHANCLETHIKQCRDLAAIDLRRSRSDPYVKVYLLPDRTKTGKRKTKVKKHTLNPVFDEVLRFPGTLEDLMTRTLSLSVWHSDMFGRNDFLGEVTLPLKMTDLANPMPKWYKLQEKVPSNDETIYSKGSLIVALKFVPVRGSLAAFAPPPPPGTSERSIDVPSHIMASPPSTSTLGSMGSPVAAAAASTGTLHVLVKEGRDLVGARTGVPLDAFLKCWLLPDRTQKQKSLPVKRSNTPNWNHTFTFPNFTLADLRERCVEVTAWDHDRLTSNSVLGGVRLSLGSGKHCGKPVDWMDSKGEEENLWRSMLDRPGLWVQACLPLRCTSMDKPNASQNL